MKLTFRFLRGRDKIFLLICFLSTIAQSWLELLIPEYIADITVLLQTSGVQPGDLVQPGAAMLGCALGSMVISIISSYLISAVSSNLTKSMRSAVFEKTMSFSLGEMSKFQASSLITRCTQNINTVYLFWANGALFLMKAVVLATMAIIKMVGQDIAWISSTGVAVLLTIVFMGVVFGISIPRMAKSQLYTDDENKLINEHITGIRVIHAFNAYKLAQNRFSETSGKLRDITVAVTRATSFLLPGVVTIIYGLTIAIYWIGAGIISGAPASERVADYANMIAFSSYAMQCVQAFMLLTRGLVQIPGLVSSLKRIKEVLDTEPTITDGEGAGKAPEETPAVEFVNVSFRYPSAAADAVKDLSFKVNKGETLAIIGATGSGKTSIINLIPRLYDSVKGEIRINGIDIRQYTLSELRSIIGYVPQRASLFSRSIASNIDFGDDGGFAKTLTDIQKAAMVGQADEFIRQKPQGYDTVLLPGGSDLSGGQRQRLTISRAVCRDPQIYLFDDSFSALDFATDKKLRAALRQYSANATVIMVAQRISTILSADKIIVIDGGMIKGMGTHDELLKTCDIYREIVETQMLSDPKETARG